MTDLDARSRRDRADKREQGRTHHPPGRQQWTKLQVRVRKSSRGRSEESAPGLAPVDHGRLLPYVFFPLSKHDSINPVCG